MGFIAQLKHTIEYMLFVWHLCGPGQPFHQSSSSIRCCARADVCSRPHNNNIIQSSSAITANPYTYIRECVSCID